MNIRTMWVVGVVIVVLAGAVYLWPKEKAATPQPPVAEKQSPTPAAIKDNLDPLLFGTWESIEDAKFIREFKADGTVIDQYQGDASATTRGTWSVADPNKEETGMPVADLAGMTVIKLTFPNDGNYPLYFTLDYLTETSLTMTYLARGNLQTYKKVK